MSKNNTKQTSWKKVNGHYIGCFRLEDEPELIHIIHSGRSNKYWILHDDAYELKAGETEFLTPKQIRNKYGILL